jgi:hypothetical protein
MQFVRRCQKVAIFDEGVLQYFGPFTPEAQAILSKYLPVPEKDTSNHDAPAPPKTIARPSKYTRVIDKPPVTSMPMGTAWLNFLKNGGVWRFVIAFVLWLLAHSIRQLSDFWVRFWAKDKYKLYKDDDEHGGYASRVYAFSYGGMAIAFFTVQAIRSCMFYFWTTFGANRLFRKQLRRVLKTPLGFFLVKPVGELIYHFASDQDKADEALPDAVHMAGAPLTSSSLMQSKRASRCLAM